ncbi:aminotransferase class III-fold pyridoxal phosphate-dependent enzyme [Temperatibacter marinus]|uniref:Aminotransferase class III-fold pyridoxal phosphate-dependent enzyme n=1 Tax=Temperatibacter marinus TaxID=1456591 RepID=A0AA52EKG6_9PROT|nr:aminotransferase class III-fold pyridoxal phosphate-dependent enzyme [Temperatibacter marinus]WND04144.1 aminotransferase class III-fold pyridoxal phosphate-dependent enzyme [Temperatibacter marinus]
MSAQNQAENIIKNDDLSAYWMPFTPNKAFKDNPRLIDRAEGLYYYTTDGRKILDGFAGLWCSNLGHGHPKITEAIQDQAAKLDYVTGFNFAHPQAFELAHIIQEQFPGQLNHVFFTNSGSEAVDTALKVALAYHRTNGEASRTRLIGRVGGYHGVGFGGISVGGMVNNRKMFGSLLSGVDHMPFPYDASKDAFSKGEATSDPLVYLKPFEEMIALHDESTIAAVIVEPMIGSNGVFLPPKGYLQALRAITKKHGILLIFDEVITAFGRLGQANGASYFGVEPDMCTFAKGVNNGAVPMGGVVVSSDIYSCFMEKSAPGIELFHGYTYSSHPLATAAGLAAQAVYKEEAVYDQVSARSPFFEEAIHSLKGEPYVEDIRNMGFAAGITIERRGDAVGARAFDVFMKCYELGVMVRSNGDNLALSPILTSDETVLETLVETVRKALRTVA